MSLSFISSSFNSTAIQENLLMSSITTPSSETVNAYDHQGAAIYIAVILVWYSSGLAMMLFLQIRPRTLQQQFLFDSSTKNPSNTLSAKPFANYRNIQADNTTKQILNELTDIDRRNRLWKIYFASSEKQNETIPQYYRTITSDGVTIDRIKRKLADIHRMDSMNDDSNSASLSNVVSTNANSSSTSAFDSSKFFSKRFPSLRRQNGGATSNSRPPFNRAHSQMDASTANTIVEMEPLVTGKGSPSNTSRKRNNMFSNRFTIEKVSNSDPTFTPVDENTSE
jgi:hypothetical protein